MTRSTRRLETGAEWIVGAAGWDFQLSATRPFTARTRTQPDSSGERVSIHDGLEVGILLTGAIEVGIEHHIMLAAPGDAWFIPMWEPHWWRVIGRDNQRVAVVFLPDFLEEGVLRNRPWLDIFSCPPSQRPTVTTEQMRKTVIAIGWELHREIEERSPGWETAMRIGLSRLLFTISRDWQPRGLPDRPLQADSHHLARIMPALKAVHAHPEDRITIPEAASACRLSPAQFSRVFRQTMGLSFGKYRLRTRLAFAAHLLLTTDGTTDGIAGQAGFVDGSHLHRYFLKHYAATPGRYREERRQRPPATHLPI